MEGLWQYSVKKVGAGADLEAALNEAGGWELVTITPNPSTPGGLLVVFRRQETKSEQAERLIEAQKKLAEEQKPPPTTW